MSEQMIPVSAILPPEWNSRLTDGELTPEMVAADNVEIAGLADSLKSEGQLQSIRVEGPVSGVQLVGDANVYLLVIGSRRLRAAKFLGWSEIRADVQPTSDTSTRVIQNIVENVKRKDLTTYETARACAKLGDEGMKGVEISARLGLSKQRVSNLAVCFEKLPQHPILDEWQAGNPAATTDFLRELVTIGDKAGAEKGATDQDRLHAIEDAWNQRVELVAEASEMIDPVPETEEEIKAREKAAKERAANKPDAPYRVALQHYMDTIKAVNKSKIAGGKLAVQVCRYLVGEIEKIPGVIEPVAEAAE